MPRFVTKVRVTRVETHVVTADSFGEAPDAFWGGNSVAVEDHAETETMETDGITPLPDLNVHEDEHGRITGIYCPACESEVYEHDYRVLDDYHEIIETACCFTLIEDPTDIFIRYYSQD